MRICFNILLSVLFSTFFLLNNLYAQTIKGKVVVDGEPAFAANVYLLNNQGIGTLTGDDGFFNLSIPDSLMNDTLVVHYLGYIDSLTPLNEIKDFNIIYMNPDQQGALLSEVVVRADPIISKEFATTKLEKSSIYMNPTSGADPLKAIRLLSYSTATEESATPELRGSSGDQSRVIINGVPIRNPVRNQQLNGMGNFSLFNAEIVGQQLVYPSNPPLEWGNSIGGIVDLRTTEDIESESETNISLSLASIGAFHSKKLGEKAFIQIYGNTQYSNLYKSINPKSLDYLNHFSSIDAGVNFRTIISNKSYLNVYSYLIQEQYKSQKGLYNYFGTQNARNIRNFNVVNYRLYTGSGSLAINLGYDQSKSFYDYEIIKDTTYQQNAFISASFNHFFNDNMSIVTGVDYEYNGYKYSGVYPYKPYNTSSIENRNYSQSGNIINNKLEAFIYGKWILGDFTAGMSGRGIFSQHNHSLFSYQANVRYSSSESHSFIVSFGKYHSVSIPNYYIRQMVFSSSKQASLDWNYNISPNCNLGAAIYWKDNHIPFYIEEKSDNIFVNNIVTGLELSGKIKFNRISLDGNYTFLRSKIDNGLGKELSHNNDFGNMFKVMVSFIDAKLFNVALSFVYRGGLHYTPIVNKDNQLIFGEINSSQYRDYFSLDLSVNKYLRLGKVGFIPFIAITNITNRANQKNFYYDYISGKRREDYYLRRLIYFGCTLKF